MFYPKLLVLLAFVFLVGMGAAFAAETKEQFYLKVNSNPNILFISGGGFYDAGASVTLEKIPEVWQDYVFIGWKVDGLWSNQNPPTVIMSRSHDVEAVFEKQTGIGKITFDTIPRISEITVDGTIYLPDELPLSFDWAEKSEHTIIVSDVVKQTPNTRYKFDSWKDQNTDVTRIITVGPEASKFIAIYKTQHFLKPISQYGTVLGGGWQDQGSTVSFELESDVVVDKKNENIRYVFNSWDLGDYLNSPTNIVDVAEPIAVRANWDEQYKLDLKTNIPDYNLFGTGWYEKGRQVALIAEPSLESPNSDTQYSFERWVSKGPNPIIIPNAHEPSTAIIMNEPYVIEAKYKKAYLVNVWTPYGTAVGSGFYPEGEVAEISITQTEFVSEPNRVRAIFSGWDTKGARTMDLGSGEALLGVNPGAKNLMVFVDGPTNVAAMWKTQYYLDVQSAEGSVEGSGWYDLGRLVPITAKMPAKPAGMWAAHTFDRWTGDYDGTLPNGRVIMNEPKTVIAEWREDNTPGIFNGIILAGVAGVAILIYGKTRNGKLALINGKLSSMKRQKPVIVNQEDSFDKFFNTRTRNFEANQSSPVIPTQPKGISKIIDWLFGR